MEKTIKIQKIIADLGLCSRRKAENLIKQKKVTVNGTIAHLGDRANFDCQLKINGKMVKNQHPEKIYLILNKPPGFLSTMHDDFNRKTAFDLVKTLVNSRVFLVGRLDLNSQGLMLFTNDGKLAYKLLHPKHEIKKIYEVDVNRKLTQTELQIMEKGMVLNDGITAPAQIVKICHKKYFTFQIIIHEGKKRQIRRMVDSFHHARVIKLNRIQMGSIKLGNLKLGQTRMLTQNEIENLKTI